MKDREVKLLTKEDSMNLGSVGYSVVGRISQLEKMIAEFDQDISIKDCPKCKHPVLAQQNVICKTLSGNYIKYGHQCLTCGSKFTCSEQQVCELIKEGE